VCSHQGVSATQDGFGKGQAFAEDGAQGQYAAPALGFAAQAADEHIELAVVLRCRSAKHMDAQMVLADDLACAIAQASQQSDFTRAQGDGLTIRRVRLAPSRSKIQGRAVTDWVDCDNLRHKASMAPSRLVRLTGLIK